MTVFTRSFGTAFQLNVDMIRRAHDLYLRHLQHSFVQRMRAYDEAVDKKIHNPAEYVKSLNLKGFFRCCIYKWKKSRVQQQWTLICQAAPKLAKRFKEVPNCLRKMIGLGVKFNIRTKQDGASSTLPVGFENVIADYAATGNVLCSLICCEYI